ncbi:cob(I)yrinic acid a,c-diamide adenosyltransferase [Candidatus Bathyarchaeota archaeon]|nr:MAG: cob(I)yrinic acid a,c-diamide adenosyltransferase [Candidatus Bathyarchaeota archaeon]
MGGFKKFSKAGDFGYTSLLKGQRVPKYDPRVDAYGVLDEAVSILGLARALSKNRKIKKTILNLQKKLYGLCSELATPPENYEEAPFKTSKTHTKEVEKLIDEYLKEKSLPNRFIIPGKTPASATLDIARTVVRRAERKVHKLIHEGTIKNVEIGCYLNRVADLLFTLARVEEGLNGGLKKRKK